MKHAARRPSSVLRDIFHLLKGIHIHPAYLAIPITFSLGAAAFEGVSLGLLIPMLNGFLTKDYSFIQDIPGLGYVLSLLPEAILTSDKLLFITLMGCFVCAVVMKNILRYSSAVSMGFLTNRALHHLRKTVFSRFLSFGKLYFDRTSVGHNATILSQFTEQVLWPVQTINMFVNALFSLTVYLTLMSLISWKLTAFALPLFVVLHYSVRVAIRKIGDISKAISARGASLGKLAVEILSTMPLVKAYSSEQQEQARYAAISDEQAHLNFRATQLKELVSPLQETITLFSVIILFSGMLYLLVRDQGVAPTSFIVYFYLVLNAATKFGALTNFRGTLANAVGPTEELMQIFDNDGKSFVPEGTDTFMGLQKSIEFRDLSFGYPGREHVLRHVSFSIPKSSMIAIVGATGSGKTTLIHLIMRLYDSLPNQLLIDGKDIRSWTLASLHRHIALVSQETLLIHDSLRRNIAYGIDHVSDHRIDTVVRQARLEEFVASLPNGLDTLVGDRGVKLSGGEKQRVSIARALLKEAEILILDEATSALDSQTEKLIQEAIDEAVRGRTSIVIAHRLSTIQHADSIVVLENGTVAEQGTLDELLKKNGTFAGLWNAQKFV